MCVQAFAKCLATEAPVPGPTPATMAMALVIVVGRWEVIWERRGEDRLVDDGL